MASANEFAFPDHSEEITKRLAAVDEANRFLGKFIFYLRPANDEEDALRAEIDGLPSVKPKAGDDAALLARGYRVGECHRNCIAAAADGLGRHVFGWTVSREAYLSHSVLRMTDGELVCITPSHTDELDADGRFEFKEDPAFTFDGTYMRRNGEYLPQPMSVVRRDAEGVRRRYAELYELVQRGELSFDEAMREN